MKVFCRNIKYSDGFIAEHQKCVACRPTASFSKVIQFVLLLSFSNEHVLIWEANVAANTKLFVPNCEADLFMH